MTECFLDIQPMITANVHGVKKKKKKKKKKRKG